MTRGYKASGKALRQADQVSAGIVEYGDFDVTHFFRIAAKDNPAFFQSLYLAVKLGAFKRGDWDACIV